MTMLTLHLKLRKGWFDSRLKIFEVLTLFKFDVCSDLSGRQLALKTERKGSCNEMGVVVQFDGTLI